MKGLSLKNVIIERTLADMQVGFRIWHSVQDYSFNVQVVPITSYFWVISVYFKPRGLRFFASWFDETNVGVVKSVMGFIVFVRKYEFCTFWPPVMSQQHYKLFDNLIGGVKIFFPKSCQNKN